MKYFLLSVLIFLTMKGSSQDLNAQVKLLYPQLQSVNKATFDVLEKSIKDFLTNRKWTDDPLLLQERIDCNFIITINAFDGTNVFTADAQIQSTRPVYGTTYNSPVLNINDKDFNFTYTDGQSLDFSEQNYTSNLASLLAFYAFIIVGLDYDTFSKFGGAPLYNRVQNVLNTAQSATEAGWRAGDSFRNRYWLLANLLDRDYMPIRESLYTYHRQGLDVMANNPSKGRGVILSVLSQLQQIDMVKQGNMIGPLFLSAKVDEIVNLLSGASSDDKIKAYIILNRIDPANSLKYESLKN